MTEPWIIRPKHEITRRLKEENIKIQTLGVPKHSDNGRVRRWNKDLKSVWWVQQHLRSPVAGARDSQWHEGLEMKAEWLGGLGTEGAIQNWKKEQRHNKGSSKWGLDRKNGFQMARVFRTTERIQPEQRGKMTDSKWHVEGFKLKEDRFRMEINWNGRKSEVHNHMKYLHQSGTLKFVFFASSLTTGASSCAPQRCMTPPLCLLRSGAFVLVGGSKPPRTN